MELAQEYTEQAIIANENTYKVLAVDHDRTMLSLLDNMIKAEGYESITLTSAVAAIEFMEKHGKKIDVIVLNREMPDMDGVALTVWLKEQEQFSEIPVIMQTGSNRPEQIQEGLDAGVFYYLAKPYKKEMLHSIISAALRKRHQSIKLSSQLNSQKNAFNLLDTCHFTYQTLEDAEDLAVFLAQCYHNPERVVTGILELLTNAVEHGNVGVGYEEKTRLIEEEVWRDAVAQRITAPENARKKVSVTLQRKKEGIYLRIVDEGKGFNWRQYLEIDPSRAADNHGRGIAHANKLSFDVLRYNKAGNQVTTCVYTGDHMAAELNWETDN